MLPESWLSMYPILGMVSLTSGLLLLCSFSRTKPKRYHPSAALKSKANFENSLSTGTTINLLTNEDSAKVHRVHRTNEISLSKSEKSSQSKSLSTSPSQEHVITIVEPERPIKRPTSEIYITKDKPKSVEKTDSIIKKSRSKSDSKSDETVGSVPSQSSLNSFTMYSIRSHVESEPEISTIRTIYRTDNKHARSYYDSNEDEEEKPEQKK